MHNLHPNSQKTHSTAWVLQSWASFIVSLSATAGGIIYLPVDAWVKGYMGMGLVFTVGSTMSLAKTVRDEHESKTIAARIDEAKIEKLLVEHHPLK